MMLELKRTPGIYLVGFMGSGKTTVGRQLAAELGWTFADLDEDIEAAEGRSISDIFATDGEAAFRRIESEALGARVRKIRCGAPTVLALGGGAFAQEQNREIVRGNGVSIWIDCPVELLWERVKGNPHRPLARDRDSFFRLFESRAASYALADYRVKSGRPEASRVVAAILELPLFR